MKNHDPLCPRTKVETASGWTYCSPEWECQCDLISRVKYDVLKFKYHEDEIEWNQGYKAGYEDAMKDCNMTFEDFKKRNEEWNEIMKAMNINRQP